MGKANKVSYSSPLDIGKTSLLTILALQNYSNRLLIKMKYYFLVIALLMLSCEHSEDDGNWDVYLADYEGYPGSITYNVDLVESEATKTLRFIVITGVTYSKCTEDGFPEDDAFEELYAISDAIGTTISKLTSSELAGTFTYQCERADYIYVSDTSGIRVALEELYAEDFTGYPPYINIMEDEYWEAYYDFLYPNVETQESRSNEAVLKQLRTAGDNLETERVIDHWFYFADTVYRNAFEVFAISEGFKIVEKDTDPDGEEPHMLHVSRIDFVMPTAINILNMELKNQAETLHGTYDGWETVVVTNDSINKN